MKIFAKLTIILTLIALIGCNVASPTPIATKTPMPSATLTATITPSPTATFIPITPVAVGTSLAKTTRQINAENIDRITSLARWGDGNVNDLKYTPNGKYLITATSIGIYVYNTSNYSLRQYIDTKTAIYKIDISPDGSLIAASTVNKVLFYSVEKGIPEKEIKAITHGLTFSPDGKTLATGTQGAFVQLWNVKDGTLIRSFEESDDFYNTIAFSPDGKLIATGGNATRIWKLDGTKLYSQGPHVSGGSTDSLFFSPDGKFLAESADGLRLWKVKDNGELTLFRKIAFVTYPLTKVISISPNGKYLAAGTTQGLFVWDMDRGATILKVSMEWNFTSGISWSPDSKFIALSSNKRGLEVWSLDNKEPKYKLHAMSGPINVLDWSSTGDRIASGTEDGNIFVFDSQNGNIVYLFKNNPLVKSVSFASDTNLLAAGFDNHSLSIWNSDGSRIKSLDDIECCSTFLSFSPDGKLLVASIKGEDYLKESVRFWSTDNWDVVKTLDLKENKRYITNIEFSPNEELIATTELYETGIIIRDTKDLSIERTLMIFRVDGFGFSPSGEYIASVSQEGSTENVAKLWQVSDGKLIYRLNLTPIKVINRFEKVSYSEKPNIIAWTPDGTLLAVGMSDGKVRIIRASDGETLTELIGHTLQVTSVVFSPDGRFLASGSLDGTIRLWGIR